MTNKSSPVVSLVLVEVNAVVVPVDVVVSVIVVISVIVVVPELVVVDEVMIVVPDVVVVLLVIVVDYFTRFFDWAVRIFVPSLSYPRIEVLARKP